MMTPADGRFFQLAGKQRAGASLSADRIIHLDARFSRAGIWSGVSELLEEAYLDLDRQGKRKLVDAYSYELHMAMPEIPLNYACRADSVIGAEGTRILPPDRAFRIVSGLVSFVQCWKTLHGSQSWIVVVRNFFAARHLASRFFTELARRLSDLNLIVYVEMSMSADLTGAGMLDVTEEVDGLNLPRLEQALLTDDECAHLENTATENSETGDGQHRLHRSALLYNSAQVYVLLGKHEQALASYEQAIAMDPHYSEYYNESANLLQQLDRYEAAIANYDKAIQYSAPYPEVYYNKAICHSRMGQLQLALEAFEHSEELDPLQPQLYLSRAEVLDELCRTDDAYADYSKAIELEPDSITARVNRAVLCYSRADFEQALADMTHVIAIDPDETRHYENRAAIYEALGHAELAALDHRKADEVRSVA